MSKKKKREDDTFLAKKTREKQNIATIMKSVDGKGIVLQSNWNYKRNGLNKHIKKRILKKM